MVVSALILLACSLPCGVADLDDVRVTTTVRAANAASVVQRLADETQIWLTAGPEMKTDVVVIDVKDAPLPELMDRLATVCSAKWVRNGDAWLLTRTKEMEAVEREQQRKDHQAELAKRAAPIAKCISEEKSPTKERFAVTPAEAGALLDEYAKLSALTDKLKEGPAYDEACRRVSEVTDSLPTERFKRQLWTLLGPDRLAAIGDDPVVFSTSPNRLQKPLPLAVQSACGRFLRDWTAFMEAARGRPASILGAVDCSADDVNAWFAAGPSKTKTLVTVRRFTVDIIQFDVAVLNRLGEIALETTDFIRLPAPDLPAKPDPGLGNTAVPLSPLTRAMMATLDPEVGRKHVPLMGEDLRAAVDTEANDPLSTAATDVLLALGRAREANLIACVPDELFELIKKRRLDLSQCRDELRAAYGDDLQVKDGWLTLKPIDPCRTRDSRADRRTLSKLARRLAEGERLTLDEAADWATWIPVDEPGIAETFSIVVAHRKAGREFLFENLLQLRLIGLLSRPQRAYLASGQVLPGTYLSRKAADYIDWLGAARWGITFLPNEDPSWDPAAAQILANDAPTEAMGGGVGGWSRLSLEISMTPSIVVEADSDKPEAVYMSGMGRFAESMEEFDRLLAQARNLAGAQDIIDDIERFRKDFDRLSAGLPAEQTTWAIHVAFNDRFELVISLDDMVPIQEEPIPLSRFPEAFLQEYRRGYDDAAKEREEKKKRGAEQKTARTPVRRIHRIIVI